MFATAITGYEPEHRSMLRRSARDWLGRARPLAAIRPLREARRYDPDFLAQLGAMGWMGGFCADEDSLGAPELVALHRELGRHVLPEPVALSGVLCSALLQAAEREGGRPGPAIAAALAAVSAGEAVATLAFAGAAGGVTAADLSLQAVPSGAGWRLEGQACQVAWAGRADHLLVAARTPTGGLLALLPPDIAPRVERRQLDGSLADDLSFEGVEVSADQVILSGPAALARLDEALDLTRLAVSAELLGAAEQLFEMTLDYLRSRQQFGRPIGANQALQFTAVDLFVALEQANSVLAAAARGFDGPGRRLLAARAKARASETAFTMARQAIQMHGAIGYTDACDVSLFVKRIMAQMAWLGTPARHRATLAQACVEGGMAQ